MVKSTKYLDMALGMTNKEYDESDESDESDEYNKYNKYNKFDKYDLAKAMREYDEKYFKNRKPTYEEKKKYFKQKEEKELPVKEKNSNVRLKVGNRVDVWNGSAKQTSGGLTKNDLMLNKDGKIVSKKQSIAASVRFGK